MASLVPALMPRLESHSLPGLNAGPYAFYPHYDGLSLINLPASICHWLGARPFGAPPLADEILAALPGQYRHVILLVVDGLGLEQFEYFSQTGMGHAPATGRATFWQRLMDQAMLAPITSISPSTTASALTSLWTGKPAGDHGILGYEMYLKEYGLIANMITHAPVSFTGDVGGLRRAGFQPETFLTVPTLGPHLQMNGIKPTALQHASIAHSGLSTMLFPSVDVVPFRSPSDLWVTLPTLLETHSLETTYTYIYWGELDELSHKFGPYDRRVEVEFTLFSYLLDGFISQMRKHATGDTLLLITADHGHLHTPAVANLETRFHPQFSSNLHLNPSGESRLAYLYLRPNREDQLREYIQSTWPGQFEMVPSETAVQSGLFGTNPAHNRLADRIGDQILFAQEKAFLWWADKNNPLNGRHGGLSRTEMVVPLIGLVI
jgi:hypothetical protein